MPSPGKYKLEDAICDFCDETFGAIPYKRRQGKARFCSPKCGTSANGQRRKFSVSVNCAFCHAELQRKESVVKKNKSGNFFCNKECRGKAYRLHGGTPGITRPSHYGSEHDHTCPSCQGPKVSTSLKCQDCSNVDRRDAGFHEYHSQDILTLKSKPDKRAALDGIRRWARTIVERSLHDGDFKCQVCSYDFHVEVAHVKSIAEFDDNTLIYKINDFDNISLLCPNHHTELDFGLLSREIIPRLSDIASNIHLNNETS